MKSPIPLRYYLSFHFGVAAILPAIAIAGLVYFFMVPDTRERTKIQHQAMADAISSQVSAYLEGGERQIKALAAYLENRGIQPGPELTALLDAQCGGGEFFETLFIFNSADAGIQAVGLPIVRRPNRNDLVGLDLSGRSFIKNIKKTGQTFLSKTFLSMVSNHLAVALAAPLPNGFLIGEITLDKLSDFIRRLPAKSGFVTMVIDGEGIVVADPMKRHWGQILDFNYTAAGEPDRGKDNAIRAFELDGEKMMGTLIGMDRIGWKVLVAQPARKVFAPLGKIFSLLAWGMAATLGLVLVLSWLLAGRFAGLFTSYANSAESIARGSYELEWPRTKTRESVRMGQSLARMAEKISQREKDLRFTQFSFDKAAVGILYIRSDGSILKVNEHAARMLGYTAEEMAQLSISDIDADANAESLDFAWRKLVEDRVAVMETLHLRKDGAIIPVEVVSNFLEYENRQFSVCFVQDISERKQMEESLRLTQFIFDKAPIGIWRIGPEGEVLDVNEAGCASLGYTREELCRMSVPDFDPNFGIKVWASIIAKLKATGTVTIESLHQRKSGEIFPIQIVENLVRFEDQEIHVAFIQDISERKQDEAELRRLRNYLSNIIDSMPSILIAVDRDGRVTQWNNQTARATGLDFDRVRSQPLVEVFPPLADETERIQASILERRVISDPKVARKVSDEIRYEDITIFPLTANGVEGAVIRVDDVTDRVRMEEMMIQSEKMLSVGGLAAGMAHEINNPLAGMMQTAEVMSMRLGNNIDIPANREAAENAGITLEAIEHFMEARGIPRMIEAIITSGRRVAAIVDNMLSFARKSDATVSSHLLGELLDRAVELAAIDYDLKKQYDFKQIKIQREYEQNLPTVPCEEAKIQQVLLNILRNGAEAMHEAGTVAPRFVFRTRVDQDTDMAVMEIEDNGPGMDEPTRKRIFEPFFTTKPVGVGTGLGLSVSYFIVTKRHGGEMDVKSSPGAGATFTVRLPMKGKTVR